MAVRLSSGALRAESILTAVAAILAAISLGSLAATRAFGLWSADAIAAIIVGAAAVPSAVIRIAVGVLCAVAAWRERSS